MAKKKNKFEPCPTCKSPTVCKALKGCLEEAASQKLNMPGKAYATGKAPKYG